MSNGATDWSSFLCFTAENLGHSTNKGNSLARSNASLYGNKEELYDRLRRHAYQGKKGKQIIVDAETDEIAHLFIFFFFISLDPAEKSGNETTSESDGQIGH